MLMVSLLMAVCIFQIMELILTKFNVHDGMGCILLKELGLELLILTARHSDAVIKRFKDLGINKIFTKVLKKQDFIKEYSKTHNLTKKEIAMMGDDLQDLAAIDEVGVFFTTPNAVDDVKDSAATSLQRALEVMVQFVKFVI